MFWFACVSGWCNKSSPLEIPLKYSLLKQTGKPLSFFRTNCFLCPFLCSPVQQLKMLQWFSCMRAVIVFNSFLFCDFLEMLLLSFQNKTFFFFCDITYLQLKSQSFLLCHVQLVTNLNYFPVLSPTDLFVLHTSILPTFFHQLAYHVLRW